MPSFRMSVSPKRRAAARFVGHARKVLQKALIEERAKSGMTQAKIARKLGVDRSVVNRQISGKGDITLGGVAELAWALGRKPELRLVESTQADGSNLPRSVETKVEVSDGTPATIVRESTAGSHDRWPTVWVVVSDKEIA